MTKALTWAERLTRAEKRGRFLKTDFTQAADWFTCAVGEHQPLFNEYGGCPEDEELRTIGVEFTGTVEENNLPEARRIYDAIQARCAELGI